MTPEEQIMAMLKPLAPVKKRFRVQPKNRDSYMGDRELCVEYQFDNEHEHLPNWALACQIHRLSLGCGARASELCALRVADVVDNKILIIRKSKSRPREVRVIPELQPFIEGWLQGPNEYLLWDGINPDRPLNRFTVLRQWQRILVATNTGYRINKAGNLGPMSVHKARHTFATWEIALRRLTEAEAATMLGDTVKMVHDYYQSVIVNYRAEYGDHYPEWPSVALAKFRNQENVIPIRGVA